ncbi:MAG TPA: rod shape-determining protein MreC [Thermomicrobiales bacterium]|nr:rod shape-determining protein MreC [Thermomicrobiales bacterium]
MTTLSTRQTIALVTLFVLASLTFIQLDNRDALDPVKETLRATLSPVLSVLGSVGEGNPSALQKELQSVKAERDQLAAENAQLRADTREVDQLRLQAKLQQDRPTWKMLQARVQTPDPTNLQKFLTIDKGAKDGVQVGMAVVAQGPNYIGQVTDVWENSARVMLVVDVSQRVGARLDSGPDGVVFGDWQNGGRLELRYLDRDAKPQPGELVLTTDSAALRTARVPGGLIVGRIGDTIDQDRQADAQSAPVIPLVQFENLQVVTVVLTDGS